MATITTEELRESISKILEGADLDSLSSKKVRKLLEDQYQEDLTERKQLIDEILMEMVNDAKDNGADTDGDQESERSAGSEKEEEELSESGEYSPPPKKKAKSSSSKKSSEQKSDKKKSHKTARDIDSDASDDSEIDDEALARKLQEEERKSRSRAVKKTQANKKEYRKNSGEGRKFKKKKENMYTRKCVLSTELADVVGAGEMARHDVVKKMWAIVRERNLFDPSNKQFALCDEQLLKVFGTKRVRMFGMMKHLKNHIKDPK